MNIVNKYRIKDNITKEDNIKELKEKKLLKTQNGIISNFTGVPIVIEENGDLIFKCKTIEMAKLVFKKITCLLEFEIEGDTQK